MHTLKITSDIKNISEVESLIDKVCAEHKINEDLYGNILIAITEGVNNAISHGNKNDDSKTVSLEVSKTETELLFSIVDEGPGFDFNDLPDPTSPENIEKPDGRGIFLMKNLSDKIEFEDSGSKVNITFVVNE